MPTRTENNVTYYQMWTKDNRIETITGNGQSVTYTYDGGGNRVKATLGPTTTVCIGNYYEQSGNLTTTYYYAGSVRIAMRQGGTVNYLHADHLGSTSLTTNQDGALVARQLLRSAPEAQRSGV